MPVKFAKICIISMFLILLLPMAVSGQVPVRQKICTPDDGSLTDTSLCNPLSAKNSDGSVQTFLTFQDYVIQVLRIFSGITGSVTILWVMFSGFRFLISQGNSEDVETAKRALQWSLSGLVVMLFSYVFVTAIGIFFRTQAIPGPDNPALTNPIAATKFDDLYLDFMLGFFGLMGVLAILMIIINGIRYMTAGGNEEQAEGAKTGLQYSIGGIIIIILAYVLVRATATFLGAK